jgi:hypothetical protein
MAELLVAFDRPIQDALGEYQARAVGRLGADGRWEGWLEFIPTDGSREVLVGAVETHQPEREHLEYWATGLTHVFLEGALQRARRPTTVRVRVVEAPFSDAPSVREVSAARVVTAGPEPVLDPFEIGRRNVDQLRQELHALNRPRLLNIITAYDLNPGGEDVGWMSDHQLTHFIVVAVETQLKQHVR